MSRKFDLIVFDLDGTLFDTKHSILNSVKYMIEYQGLKKLTEDEVKSFLGPPLEASIRKYYTHLTDEEVFRSMDIYREHYKNVELLNTELYPGMLDVIKQLKDEGHKIALATYKLIKCVEPLFDHFDLKKYFHSLRGTVDGKDYTKVDIINMAIDDCKMEDKNRICMIGDTEHDFKGAIQCGIKFIGMTYGFGYRDMNDDELNYGEFLGYCDHATEILEKIKR